MRQEGDEALPGALASQLYLWVTGGQSPGKTMRGSVECPPQRKPTQGAREPVYLNSSSPESRVGRCAEGGGADSLAFLACYAGSTSRRKPSSKVGEWHCGIGENEGPGAGQG